MMEIWRSRKKLRAMRIATKMTSCLNCITPKVNLSNNIDSLDIFTMISRSRLD